jgi:hypothetical protein
MRAALQDLRLARGISLVDTPRAAAILLIAGDIAETHRDALARVHDLLPHPRATVAWGTADPFAHDVSATNLVDGEADVFQTVRSVFEDLLAGRRASEPALLPDIDPVAWRGVGPYGQGGSGMTGGNPYGRPMAELQPDRDGLRLDVLPMALGPFFPRLPTGLVLDLKTAGDVVLEAAVIEAVGGAPTGPRVATTASSPFIRAVLEPGPIADLELARAQDHLRWLADALTSQGLPGFGLGALRLAHDIQPGDQDRIRRLSARLRRTGLFRWSLPRLGRIDPQRLAGQGLGPLARAAGLAEDLRVEDAGYRALGFEPLAIDRNDPIGRWQVRLEEAGRSLELAARAGARMTSLVGRVESPRGRLELGDGPTDRALPLVPELLSGLEWGDAVATLISLDLDLEESSAAAIDVLRASA